MSYESGYNQVMKLAGLDEDTPKHVAAGGAGVLTGSALTGAIADRLPVLDPTASQKAEHFVTLRNRSKNPLDFVTGYATEASDLVRSPALRFPEKLVGEPGVTLTSGDVAIAARSAPGTKTLENANIMAPFDESSRIHYKMFGKGPDSALAMMASEELGPDGRPASSMMGEMDWDRFNTASAQFEQGMRRAGIDGEALRNMEIGDQKEQLKQIFRSVYGENTDQAAEHLYKHFHKNPDHYRNLVRPLQAYDSGRQLAQRGSRIGKILGLAGMGTGAALGLYNKVKDS